METLGFPEPFSTGQELSTRCIYMDFWIDFESLTLRKSSKLIIGLNFCLAVMISASSELPHACCNLNIVKSGVPSHPWEVLPSCCSLLLGHSCDISEVVPSRLLVKMLYLAIFFMIKMHFCWSWD